MQNIFENKSSRFKIIGLGAAALVVIALIVLAVVMFFKPGISVPGDYRTIQAAIEAAKDGNVIIVEPGVYYERIDFMGKNITVRSTKPDDPEVVANTIIDGRRRGSVVTFRSGEGAKAELKGFTINGGVGTMETIAYLYDGEEVVSTGYFGGGILIIGGSSPTIAHNVISGNQAELDGGGIAVLDNSNPSIINNVIEENWAFNGGGITVWNSNPVIENNKFFWNVTLNL